MFFCLKTLMFFIAFQFLYLIICNIKSTHRLKKSLRQKLIEKDKNIIE